MNITQHKINNYSEGVSSLPDYPSDSGYTAESLKAVFDSRSDKEIKEKHNALIDELSEILTKQQESIEDINGASVVSAHDDLAAIIPADGEMYIIRYDNMPAYAQENDADGNKVTVITDTVCYRMKIGDGKTALSDLPFAPISNFQVGEGAGSMIQLDPTYDGGEDREGSPAKATGQVSFAQGKYTEAHGKASVAMNYGSYTDVDAPRSFACNESTKTFGRAAFASGRETEAHGVASNASGYKTIAKAHYSHAEGYNAKAEADYSHAEGSQTTASGVSSHAEGHNNIASGDRSHAEGSLTVASGEVSHAEGYNTKAEGIYSHTEGNATKATGDYSHAEGASTEASGKYAHSQGSNTKATSTSAHAEGHQTTASGQMSHAEGRETVASGKYAHAGGYQTTASTNGCIAHGTNLTTNRHWQAVFGQFNAPSSSGILVIGNGADAENRANAFVVGYDNSFTLGSTKLTEEDLKNLKTGAGGTTPVVSIHDDLVSIIPKEGEMYIIKYHDMPYGEDPNLISDAVFYRTKIGDGITNLADLPVTSNIQAGNGNGSIRLVDPTYDNGEDAIDAPDTVADGQYSVSLGKYTKATGKASAAINYGSEANGKRSFACNSAISNGERGFSANKAQADGGDAAAFGRSVAAGITSFASGQSNQAKAQASFVSGQENIINESAVASSAEGGSNIVNGKFAHAGGYKNEVDGNYAHACGYSNKASGTASFVGGNNNEVSGQNSWAIGKNSIVAGENSGSIGEGNIVYSNLSFAGGTNNVLGAEDKAISRCFTYGHSLIASNNNLTVVGRFNKANAGAPFVVGWGEDNENRNNLLELLRSGVLRINTTHQSAETDEPTLMLGETALTKSALSDMLGHRKEIDDIKALLSACIARIDAYIAGGGEVPDGVATSFVTLDMFNAHVEDTENPHSVTAEQVNVDLTGLATTEYVDSSIQSAVLDSWEEKV